MTTRTTVTRGLPSALGKDYQRLLRLKREYDHMDQWHGCHAQRLIVSQCETLHYRVYGSQCYYGGLPTSYALTVRDLFEGGQWR